MKETSLRYKRIYELPEQDDGFRVLVDRLWPRGVRKEDAYLDAWLKDVAPSPELRREFNHDPARFETFHVMYRRELVEDHVHCAAVKQLLTRMATETVTLLYAAKDPVCNHAVVLHAFLMEQWSLSAESEDSYELGDET